MKDSVGLKKNEERDRQFLVEKLIHGVEFSNSYENSIEKKPEINKTVESNYRILIELRRVYQHLYADIADIFIEYIHSLDADEIQELDEDLKTNGWGAKTLLEIENSFELSSIFQLIYYLNGRLPLTNGLLVVPDSETPDGKEKINLKNLHEMFKDSPQFLGALGIFFGLNISVPKNTITELYKNLSYETLSGTNDFTFGSVSDLISGLSFKIKESTLSNRDRQKKDQKSSDKIIKDPSFVELPDQFEEELVEDLFKNLEHKKIEYTYIETQVQDAETIEIETKNKDDEFSELKQLFNDIGNAATEQKQQNEIIDLTGNVLDKNNPFNDIKTDDIYIEDYLFDNNDTTDIKDRATNILETINLDDDIDIPSDDEIAIDAPKKVKITTDPNRLWLAFNRIKKKYERQRQKGSLKRVNKKASK